MGDHIAHLDSRVPGWAIGRLGDLHLARLRDEFDVKPVLGSPAVHPGLDRVTADQDLHDRDHGGQTAGKRQTHEKRGHNRYGDLRPVGPEISAGAPEVAMLAALGSRSVTHREIALIGWTPQDRTEMPPMPQRITPLG